MINLKSNAFRLIVLLVIFDAITLFIRAQVNYFSFGLFFVPQALITFINFNYDKGKLYEYMKYERQHILSRYFLWGKYSNWEIKVLRIANENNDELLKEVGQKAMILNFIPYIMVLNIIIVLYISESLQF